MRIGFVCVGANIVAMINRAANAAANVCWACCFPLQVRHYLYQELALQLRPVLEGVIKANDVPPGTPYEFNAAACARRYIRNMSQSILGSLDDQSIQDALLQR
jgi:hypothetical protein